MFRKPIFFLATVVFLISCSHENPDPTNPVTPDSVITSLDSANSIIVTGPLQNVTTSSISNYSLSGNLNWRRSDISSLVFSLPGFDGQNLLAGTQSKINCLNVVSGANNWVADIGQSFALNSTFHNDTVIIAKTNPSIIQLRQKSSGSILWSKQLQNGLIAAPFILGNKIYCITVIASGLQIDLTAYDLTTQNQVWTRPINYEPVTSNSGTPLVENNKLYIGLESHQVYCLDPNTGSIFWQKSDYDGMFVYRNGNIYINHTYVYPKYGVAKIDKLNGSIVWQSPLDLSPLIEDTKKNIYFYRDALYVCTQEKVYRLDDNTGAITWSKIFNIGTYYSFKFIGNTVYADGTNLEGTILFTKKIYLFNAFDLSLKDSVTISPTSVKNISIISRSGKLY